MLIRHEQLSRSAGVTRSPKAVGIGTGSASLLRAEPVQRATIEPQSLSVEWERSTWEDWAVMPFPKLLHPRHLAVVAVQGPVEAGMADLKEASSF